jgi:hypothetical protein
MHYAKPALVESDTQVSYNLFQNLLSHILIFSCWFFPCLCGFLLSYASKFVSFTYILKLDKAEAGMFNLNLFPFYLALSKDISLKC